MLNEQEVKAAYCELAPKLTNYLVANGLEYTVACDIVQETFIRLWKKSGELSATDSISGFVFAVARNLRTDYYRRSKFMIYQDEIADEDAGMTDPAAKKYIRRPCLSAETSSGCNRTASGGHANRLYSVSDCQTFHQGDRGADRRFGVSCQSTDSPRQRKTSGAA